MSAPATVSRAGLVACTRAAADAPELLEAVEGAGFAWLAPDRAFVATGVAARAPVDEVERLLAGIAVDDEVGVPGTGAIACGALPFDLDGGAELVVPERVIGRDGDGRMWVTRIAPDPHTTDDVLPAQRGHHEFTARGATSGTELMSEGTGREAWDGAVRRALDAVDAGEVTKVVVSRDVVVAADSPFDVVTILAHLRAEHPGCFVFAHEGIVGASPELLVARSGLRATSCPMAGTAFGPGDEALAELAASTKDAAEHRAVVDAVAGVLAEDATASPRLHGPEPVHVGALVHLATTVDVTLDPRETPSALVLARRLHPTPAVGGVPRDTARRLIAEVEPGDRGRYAGPVGWVDASGDGEWAIALRCAEVSGRRAVLRAGAGIVAGSDPAAEWRETEAKLAPMRAALGVDPPPTVTPEPTL